MLDKLTNEEEEERKEDELISWIKNMRQIMVDVG